jgi:hypothetical protein
MESEGRMGSKKEGKKDMTEDESTHEKNKVNEIGAEEGEKNFVEGEKQNEEEEKERLERERGDRGREEEE